MSMLTHTYPHKPLKEINVASCNHQADSPLYVWMSLLRPCVMKQNKSQIPVDNLTYWSLPCCLPCSVDSFPCLTFKGLHLMVWGVRELTLKLAALLNVTYPDAVQILGSFRHLLRCVHWLRMDKDLFIGPQEFVMGYSKAPEQPQCSARPIYHSHAVTRTGREPATIRIAA